MSYAVLKLLKMVRIILYSNKMGITITISCISNYLISQMIHSPPEISHLHFLNDK